MKGSNLERLGRVIVDLAAHPRNLGTYLFHGPFSKRSPLELGWPWFSLAAIRFLDGYITSSMSVFEYGSGGSTIYFAKRAKRVVSTEDDESWLERVGEQLARAGLHNAELQHRPYDFHRAEDFEHSAYLLSIPDQVFDVIVVDGKEEGIPVRPTCFRHAESRIREGGIIIVDDSWRYPELRTANRARSWREFRSIGPCRAGVTSTDVFFY